MGIGNRLVVEFEQVRGIEGEGCLVHGVDTRAFEPELELAALALESREVLRRPFEPDL
jgi:hypothetical protein